MNRLFVVLIALLVTPLLAEDKKDGDNKTFIEKGKFSVDVPEQGFEWKKFQDIKSDNITGASYLCTKENSKKYAILVVLDYLAKTDQEKRIFLTKQFDEYTKNRIREKEKIIEGDKLKLKTKIQERISYPLKVQSSDGSEFYYYRTTVFGKNTFTISIKAPTADEAKAFQDKILKSFKELENK